MFRFTYVVCLVAFAGLLAQAQEVPGEGLALWLKADAVAGVKSGDPLATWPDGSGGKRDAVQPDAARQPRWVADGLHGKPVVRFTGTGSLLTPATLALPAAHSIFVVARDASTMDNGPFVWFEQDRTAAAGPAMGSGKGGTTLRVRNYPGLQELPLTRDTASRYSLLADTAGVRLYKDGRNRWLTLQNAWTGAFPDGGTTGRLVLGQHGTNTGQFFTGDLAEVLVYTRAVSAAERQRIEGYLAKKYTLARTAQRPAVLCLGSGGPEAALARKLAADYGLQVDRCELNELTWERLTRVNAVILFDMSRLNPDTKAVNSVEISPEGFARVSELLRRYVQAGGGLYCYGASFIHMADEWSTRSLNAFLQALDAQVLFAELHDLAREAKQPEGAELRYAQAATIAAHPATARVKTFWYPVGSLVYGPWTRPLALGAAWTPLLSTSEQFIAKTIDPKSLQPVAGTPVAAKRAVIYAARTFGNGRIVLNGSESTISFFGYGYSPFADAHWGRVGMEKGLNGVPSDGYALLASSLSWLTAPSLADGEFGGYVAPPPTPPTPRVIKAMTWNPAREVTGETKYYKGVFGATPALGGGAGSVAEWAAAAAAQGLDYLVLSGDFAKMTRAQWDQLVAECKAASREALPLIPALITRDLQDNSFLQCGASAWPRPERLAKKDPQRVQDHLGYWMNDANFPLRAPFLFSRGQYPPWLHSGYDTFALRTYAGGKLVEDNLAAFMQNQTQGDRSRLITITLLGSPAELAGVPEFSYVRDRNFVSAQFHGGSLGYVSSGPRVLTWTVSNATCETGGQLDVPGTARWRATLKVASDVPLRSVTIYDGTAPWRRYAVTGNAAQITLDGLHDTRHVLTAVVEDTKGGRAVTGSLETQNARMYQIFCSDRCNIMTGVLRLRNAQGLEKTEQATNHLYKAGRLYFGTVFPGESLPGIDGSGSGAYLGFYASLRLQGEGDTGEMRSLVHQINRPYESGDAILFDTPIRKRSPATDHEIYGHAPYVDLVEPKVAARLVQYHFYRNPALPTAVIGDLSLTVTDPAGVQLQKGWQGFSARFTDSWGKPARYMIFDAAGKPMADGPSADEKTGTRWTGTLPPGASIFFPAAGEGFYVLDGTLDVVLECTPSKGWFRLHTGRFNTPKLAQGDRLAVRVLVAKIPENGETAAEAWRRFGLAYAIIGDSPSYTVKPAQGTVVSSRYLLEVAAKDGGFLGTMTTGGDRMSKLPNVLPVKVTGLNPRWTAGVVDMEDKSWRPLGVVDGAGYTTLYPPTDTPRRYFLGNLVRCDSPEVDVTLLPDNAGGTSVLEVHNPTDHPVTTTVRVPLTTHLAPQYSSKVTMAPGTTVRVEIP